MGATGEVLWRKQNGWDLVLLDEAIKVQTTATDLYEDDPRARDLVVFLALRTVWVPDDAVAVLPDA